MRAADILQRQFKKDLERVHRARAGAVFAVVLVVVQGAKLALTALGRAVSGRTSHKHGIKRVDRLLGNKRLHAELLTFYRAIARRLQCDVPRPVVIVDWTAVTPTLWALVAAIPCDGRAAVIYGETHPISRYLKPRTNSGFLRRLKQVLPAGSKPIIVTDAGFRSPWMKLVEKMGWDYVCRIRHVVVRIRKGDGWLSTADLWKRTRSAPSDFGWLELGARVRHSCRVVGIRAKRGAIMEPKKIGSRKYKAQRSAKEPWILASSLKDDVDAAKIVALYRTRMLLEETFRDAKSDRFGFSLSQARTRSADRANVLLLLAALAHVFVLLLGLIAEARNVHIAYQANTVRSKRVLSLSTLGRLVASNQKLLRTALTAENWLSLSTHSRFIE